MAFEILPPISHSLTVRSFDAQAMLDKVSMDIEIAASIVVDSDTMLEEAQLVAGRLATVARAIEAERKERKQPVLNLAAWLDEGYNAASRHLLGLVDSIKPKILAYQEQLREQAQRAAEEERVRRAALAAAAAKAEAEARTAAEAALAEAAKAREGGSQIVSAEMEQAAAATYDSAREAAQQAAMRAAAPPAMPPTKVKGSRTRWLGTVTNKAEAVAHIGAMVAKGDTSLLHLLVVDTSALNKQADLQRDAFDVPGLRSYPQESVSIRGVAV